MKLMKRITLAAGACLASVLTAVPAAAQAPYIPYLTVTANGSVVTIQWTPINEALGYQLQIGTAPGASNIAVADLPKSVTRIVVTAPNGTYYLRVRATAGALAGPFSNEASITVGGPDCNPPPAPVASFTVQGPSVTIHWSGGNAIGYRVEFSRYPGATELAYNVSPTTTSLTQHVGMLGTFYARVVAGNACGSTTAGNEVAFTITDIGGSGPRTPDPPPGQMLPLPGYGASVVASVAAAYPHDLANSCGNNVWLFRVVQALRQRDSRWGLNWKRMVVGDMSQDVVTYNFGAGPDEGTTNVYAIDVISSHCGNASWNWLDITDPNGAGAKWTLQPYLAAGFPADGR
jgi:hypothetical protein